MSERLFEYAPSVAVALEAGNKSAITAAIFCLESCHEEILRQKAELSLAEEGLANYALENERLKSRCWALAFIAYPQGAPREAVAGDIGADPA